MNQLENRRRALGMINQELKDINSKLDNEDLKNDEEEDLYKQVRAKREKKKNYTKEINKLVEQTSVRVNYERVKTGLTAVLSPGLMLQPSFLPEPVCWCPKQMPATNLVEETTSLVEDMPLISAKRFTAKGDGLKFCDPNKESKFDIIPSIFAGKRCDAGSDQFVVESK